MKMAYSSKAYLNATGSGQVLNLTHDVKRVLADSQLKSGLVNIVSMLGTTAIRLMENDPQLQKGYFELVQGTFKAQIDKKAAPRRSGSGAGAYHYMAAMIGLSLTLPFAEGRLSASPFHDIVAFDFEPKSGRREFVITVLGDAAAK